MVPSETDSPSCGIFTTVFGINVDQYCASRRAARTFDVGLAQRHHVLFVGDLAAQTSIALLVLEEHHRIVITDRALQQALAVVRRARNDDFQPWHMKEQRFDRL